MYNYPIYAHTTSMNYIFLSIKKSPKYFAYPFLFCCGFVLVVNLINLFPIEAFDKIYSFINANYNVIFGTMSVFFVNYFENNSKKAVVCASCFSFGDMVFYSFSNVHFSLVFSVIAAFIFSALVRNIDLVYAYFLLLLISLIVGLSFGLVYDYLFNILKVFCAFLSKREFLFGVVSNAYSVFFSDNLSELFFTKDYSLSTFVDGEIVSGIKNIFAVSNDNSKVSVYLTGKYLVSIFGVLGFVAALYNKTNPTVLIVLSGLALAFGDIKLFSLYILLYNPFLYLGFMFLTFVCYLVPVLLDIRIGYLNNGSLVELIKYGNRWIYFILCGFVIAIMSYFVAQIVFSKFDIESRKILPKEVRQIVKALGGERNIESVTDSAVIVKNPNLINVLELDCDINENEITLHYGELDLLKEYY